MTSLVDAMSSASHEKVSQPFLNNAKREMPAGSFTALIISEQASTVQRFSSFEAYFAAYGPPEYQAAAADAQRKG